VCGGLVVLCLTRICDEKKRQSHNEKTFESMRNWTHFGYFPGFQNPTAKVLIKRPEKNLLKNFWAR
jgi:hypothetical protein